MQGFNTEIAIKIQYTSWAIISGAIKSKKKE